MKRIIATAILVLGTSFGFTTHASAQTGTIRADVPFDFAVGNRVLPQGTYRISADGDFLSFDKSDHKTHLFVLAPQGDPAKDKMPVLVFDQVHDKYFLRKVVTGSTATSKDWPMSRIEKKSRELSATRNVYAENSSR